MYLLYIILAYDFSMTNDQAKLISNNDKIPVCDNLLSTGIWVYRDTTLSDWSYTDVKQWDLVPETIHYSVIPNYTTGVFVAKNPEKKIIHYNQFHSITSLYSYQFRDPAIILLLEQTLESNLKELWGITIVDEPNTLQISDMKTPMIPKKQVSLPLQINIQTDLLNELIDENKPSVDLPINNP